MNKQWSYHASIFASLTAFQSVFNLRELLFDSENFMFNNYFYL